MVGNGAGMPPLSSASRATLPNTFRNAMAAIPGGAAASGLLGSLPNDYLALH
jgi:hypothetical protein